MNIAFSSIAMALFAGFLGILIWHVPRLDLIAVVAVTVALALYDIATTRR